MAATFIILENILEDNQLVQFDALKVYKKYTDCFDIDKVPESERKAEAKKVADYLLTKLSKEHNQKVDIPDLEL